MDPPTVNGTSLPHTPLNDSISIPVSPKSNDLPRHVPHTQGNDSSKDVAHGQWSQQFKTLCLRFIDKVKQVFGVQSLHWLAIDRALNRFIQGAMSKKDAHQVIKQAIGDDPELNQGLADILDHNEADWGSDDWSQSINPPAFTQSLHPISPDFLQPRHEPQLTRLPSMLEALSPGPYTTRPPPSINPAFLQPPYADPYQNTPRQPGQDTMAFESYYRFDSNQVHLPAYTNGLSMSWNQNPFVPNSLSSPAPLVPNTMLHPPYLASPSMRQDLPFAPSRDGNNDLGLNSSPRSYNSFGYGMESHPLVRLTAEQFYPQHPLGQGWSEANGVEGWNKDRQWQHGQSRATAERQGSHSAFSGQAESTPQLVSGQLSSANASPALGTPMTVPLGQPSFDSPAAAKQEHYGASGYPSEDGNIEDAGGQSIEFPDQGDEKPRKSQPANRGGPFIHAICGKGFSTRSAVKKHHWGPKADDTLTTRGCWAKNQKPNRAWDEHPSCQALPQEETGKPANKRTRARRRTESDTSTAPLATPMVTRDNPPNAAARSLPPNAQFSPQGFEHPSTADQHSQVPFYRQPNQQFGSPAAHGLDNLVTAASLASRIDAPKPQEHRNDSVVAHLDAQAAAAERNAIQPPPWMPPTGFGGVHVNRGLYDPGHAGTIGLGITHGDPDSMSIGSFQNHDSAANTASASAGGLANRPQVPQNSEDAPRNLPVNSIVPSNGNGTPRKRQRKSSKKFSVPKSDQQQPEAPSSSSPARKKAKA